MQTENTAALRILMNEDLYLLQNDFLAENNSAEILSAPELTDQNEEVKVRTFTFIGKNQKNFLVVTHEALQENHLKALENTLLRKQLSLDDVAIIDYSAYGNLQFEELNTSFMPQKLVLFGLEPQLLSLPVSPVNEIHKFNNIPVLYTYSFDEMLGNKEKTKAFWEPMKVL